MGGRRAGGATGWQGVRGRWRGWIAAAIVAVLVLSLLAAAGVAFAAAPAGGSTGGPANGPVAWVLPVTGEIDPGLATLVEKVLKRAEANPQVRVVVLEITTLGGQVGAALRIKDAMLGTRLPTVALVQKRATSAGALISLAAQKLYVAPNSTIGDAEPVPYSDKAVSFVSTEFEATAQARGRNKEVARAMVDKNRPFPGFPTSLPLNLTWTAALDLKIADGEATTAADALRLAGYGDARIVQYEFTAADQLGRFLTRPLMAILLLILGIGGLAVEIMKPGVTLPGLVGITALAAFVGGHWLIGSADWLTIGLILLGAALLVIEAFVPGFGLFGVAGVLLLGVGLVMMVPTFELGVWYIAIATVGGAVLLAVILRRVSRHGLGRWLTLNQQLDDRAGVLPARVDLASLLHQEGTTLTPLRPAGTAEFGQRRVDVVTEGEFVATAVRVKVVAVDGTRIVVRAERPQKPE